MPTKVTNPCLKSTRDADNVAANIDFNFPFKPYDIQLKLMKSTFTAIEDKKFALLESPTGTGKSLSLICSSLTWLEYHKHSTKASLEAQLLQLNQELEKLKIEEEQSSDWLSVQAKVKKVKYELEDAKAKLELFIKIEDTNLERWRANLHSNETKITKPKPKKQLNSDNSDCSKQLKRKAPDCGLNEEESSFNDNLSVDEKDFLLDLNDDQLTTSEKEDCFVSSKQVDVQDTIIVRPKIYYASRTHSQLSQFINEFKKTKFARNDEKPCLKTVELASRANYCINQSVLKLKDSGAINDKCTELQKETKAENKCPYLKAESVEKLKEEILVRVHDIEDLVLKGKIQGACPYYATRKALSEAELVVLPYNNLLHQETRKASDLDLQDSVVIIDEAHNVLETISSIHSVSITGQQLLLCHYILTQYYKRYKNRLKPCNAERVQQLIKCVSCIIRYLQNPKKAIAEINCSSNLNVSNSIDITDDDDDNDEDNINEKDDKKISAETKALKPVELKKLESKEYALEVNKFLNAANLGDYNIFKIVDYIERSSLPKKLKGFFYFINKDNTDLCAEVESKTKDNKLNNSKKAKTKTNDKTAKQLPRLDLSSNSYPMYSLLEFLKALNSLNHDGKVLTYDNGKLKDSVIKFLLLNPASQFKQMANECRSILLAGGTMQPFNEFLDLLFAPLNIDKKRIFTFTCGHIIPKENLYAATLSFGPTSKQLELSYKTKHQLAIIDELGKTIANLSMIVPAGMVCFLPSYEWEAICYARWKHIGIISMIENRAKKVYREPKLANQVQLVLEDYARVIVKGKESNRGALLLSVVGGKVSEGINFNDDLGRCVVMLGLPFANIKSLELQLRISFYTKVSNRSQASISTAGQQYYHNLCLKGVNQSIGRAIRHKDDFASIILLDWRYSQTSSAIRQGLPAWISSSVIDHQKFGSLFSQLKQFYSTKHSLVS